jgi:hypothetical protein
VPESLPRAFAALYSTCAPYRLVLHLTLSVLVFVVPGGATISRTAGLLAVRPFELKGTQRPIGIVRRRVGALSPAAELLVDEVRAAANG